MEEKNVIKLIKDEISRTQVKDQLEIARLIYIVLGKLLEYDPTYENASTKKMLELRNQHLNLENLDKRRIICTNWADMYLELLTSFGINAYKQSAHHSWIIIELEDFYIYADATLGIYNDLAKIKYDENTDCFYPVYRPNKNEEQAKLPHRLMSEEFDSKLLAIDKKIGYKDEILSKQETFLNELKTKVEYITPLSNKIAVIFAHLPLKNSGIYENNSYIKHVLEFILTKDELENIKGRDLIKKNIDESIELIKCISIKENNTYHYYLLKNNYGLIKTNEKQIIKLALYGYKLGEKKIPGIIFPIKFKITEKDLSIFQKINTKFQNFLEQKLEESSLKTR